MARSRLVPVFDGHNDTLLHLALKNPGSEESFFTGREGHIDLPKARAGGLATGPRLTLARAVRRAQPRISRLRAGLRRRAHQPAKITQTDSAIVRLLVILLGQLEPQLGLDLVGRAPACVSTGAVTADGA